MLLRRNRNKLGRTQSDQFLSLLERLGLNASDAELVEQFPSLALEMLRPIRARYPNNGISGEMQLKERFGNEYLGTDDAHLYLGELTDNDAPERRAMEKMRRLSAEKEPSVHMLVWMPPLSVADILNMLPRQFLLKHPDNLLELSKTEQAWATDKMVPGLRLIHKDPSKPLQNGDRMLLPSEMTYLAVLQWLKHQKKVTAKRVLTSHKKPNVTTQVSIHFLGYSDHSSDRLGFRFESPCRCDPSTMDQLYCVSESLAI